MQEPDEAAELIIGEVTLLANLVRDLNWLAETDSGDLRLSREAVAAGQLLESELQRWQPPARMGQISLELEAWPGLPVLDLDPIRMSQALGNVVQNALQHTEPGARITIAGVAAADGRLAITVTDDGAGIAAEDLPHVFDRLYRSDESRARHGRLGAGAVDRARDRERARGDDHGGERRSGGGNDGPHHPPGGRGGELTMLAGGGSKEKRRPAAAVPGLWGAPRRTPGAVVTAAPRSRTGSPLVS